MTAVLPIYTYMSIHGTQEHTHILYTDRYKNEKSKDLKITFKMRLVCNLDGKKYVFCDSIFNLLVDFMGQ